METPATTSVEPITPRVQGVRPTIFIWTMHMDCLNAGNFSCRSWYRARSLTKRPLSSFFLLSDFFPGRIASGAQLLLGLTFHSFWSQRQGLLYYYHFMAPSLAKRATFHVSENSTNGELLSDPFNHSLYKRQNTPSSAPAATTVTSRVVLLITVTATTPIFLPPPSTTSTGNGFNRVPSATPAPTAQTTTGTSTSTSTETKTNSTTLVPIAPPPPVPNASGPSSPLISYITVTGTSSTQIGPPTGTARNPSSSFPPPRPPQSRMVEIGVVVAIVLGCFFFISFALGLWIYGRRYQSSGRSWMHWRKGGSKSRGKKYGSRDFRNGGRFLPPSRFPGVPASDGRPSMLFLGTTPAFTFVSTEGSGPTSPSISPLETLPTSRDPSGQRRKSSASSLGSGEFSMSQLEMIRSLDPVTLRRESHVGSLPDEWTRARGGRELPSR